MSHDSSCTPQFHGVGRLALEACVMEVLAAKAGNVYPGADFDDSSWSDFVTSGAVCGPILDIAPSRGVGQTVLDCVQITREAVGVNTNLGIVLLLSPLCAVPRASSLREGIPGVLANLSMRDAEQVYEAIRIASPAGLGSVSTGDVHEAPTMSLVHAMTLAASRDRVARQYAHGFSDLLGSIVPRLMELVRTDLTMDQAIVRLHLELIAQGDTLIARKAGAAVAVQAARRAQEVCDKDWPRSDSARSAFASLDAWLREGGRRRNPGTSADLVAAALFVALREGTIKSPMKWAAAISSSPCG